jgi:hypothetical protein
MEILIKRKYFKPAYTIGVLYVDNEEMFNTLELPKDYDGDGISNEPDKECVAPGEYLINLTWSAALGKYFLEVVGVPCRVGIRIHPANYPNEIKGCIATGKNKVVGGVVESRNCYEALLRMIFDRILKDIKLNKDQVTPIKLKIVEEPAG